MKPRFEWVQVHVHFASNDDADQVPCKERGGWRMDIAKGGPSPLAYGKESTCSAGDRSDMGLIPGRSPGEGHGNPVQYSCLENSMDRGAWQAPVYGVAKSWTPVSN